MITDIDFVGFEDELQKLRLSLVDGPKELDVVSVVGMPGNGKTTLAQKLYQEPLVRMHFDIRAWCTVSQFYRKKEVWYTILHQLDSNCSIDEAEDSIAERIAQNLKRRRYLVIVDDIWDIKAWNDLRRYLPNDNNGSRVLITTRLHDVAKHTSSVPGNVVSLRLFTECESYELFERKSGLKYYHSDKDLLQVGHQIAMSCKGLPLAIAVVTGHLAKEEKNVEDWKKLLAGLTTSILNDKNGPYRVMVECYNCLPNHLKPCFMYAGVLGAHKLVCVRKLKLLWIAEGFVCDNKLESLDKQADDILMDLINRSLVLPTKGRTIGGVKEFQMHDLLKDICLELSEEHNFMHKIKKSSGLQPFDSEELINKKFSIWSRGCNFQLEKTSGSSFFTGYSMWSRLTHPFGSFGKDDLHAAMDSLDFDVLQVVDVCDEFIIHDILDRIKQSSHLKYLAAKDSSLTPNMDEFDNDEIIGGMEVGEMMDLNAGQSHTDDGSAAPEALEDLQSNAYGKGTRPKKSIVHSEMEVVTFPDGTKKWKCKWCGALYTFDEKWKSTSNGKKHLLVCLQRKLEKGSFEKEASQSRLSFGDGDTSIGSWKYNHHKLYCQIEDCKVLLDKHSEGSEKPHLQILASEMKLKYDKYWSQSNILISIGAVLDPRYKMIFIAWVYPFLYPDGDEAKTFETLLSKNLESLFKLYETKYKKDFPGSTIQTQGVSTSTGLGKRSFEMFLESVQGNSLAKSDLESYLEEVPLKCPAGGVKFDVLTWWMANEAKYPILSKLAKDILSIPVTTVASESTFSAGKRVIDPKRASMKTSTVEMLLCGGDWVKEMYGIKKGSKAPEENDVEETLQFDFGSVTPDELSTQRGATTSNLQQP